MVFSLSSDISNGFQEEKIIILKRKSVPNVSGKLRREEMTIHESKPISNKDGKNSDQSENANAQADIPKIPAEYVFTCALMRRVTGQSDPFDPYDRIVDYIADQLIIQVPREDLLEYAKKMAVRLFSRIESQLMSFPHMLSRGKDLSSDFMADLSKRCGDLFVKVVQDRLDGKRSDREARYAKELETVNEALLQLLKKANSSSNRLP